MKFFTRLRKSAALRSYKKQLPRLLEEAYGPAGSARYTPAQIRDVIVNAQLNTMYLRYACVMFATKETLVASDVISCSTEQYNQLFLEIRDRQSLMIGSFYDNGTAQDAHQNVHHHGPIDHFSGGGNGGGG